MEEILNYKNDVQWITKWLLVWSMEYPLSPKEMELTTILIARQISLVSKKLNELEVKELLLCTSYRKIIQEGMGISESSLNYYLNALKEKEVLVNGLIIERLLPKASLTFRFNKIHE